MKRHALGNIKHKLNRRLARILSYNRLPMLLFVLLFASVGVAYLFITRAATPTNSFEAENSARIGTTVNNDPSASGNSYLQFGTTQTTVGGDVTPQVQVLGKPFTKAPYANNVWDMEVWDGRLYLGHGNSSNCTPSGNAGPVPIVSYGLASGQFTSEFTVDEEQIEIWRVLNGKLATPGHDPRESNTFGNFYRLETGGWLKYRTIPYSTHTYDMYSFQDKLFAALGLPRAGATLASSTDGGQTWSNHAEIGGKRAYTFAELRNVLYAFPAMFTQIEVTRRGPGTTENPMEFAMNYNPANNMFSSRQDLTADVLFPGLPASSYIAKLVRSTNFRDQLVYIGGNIHNDHQTDPFGAYKATSFTAGGVQVQRLPIGSGNKPWDITTDENRLFLLVSEKVEGTPDTYITKVLATTDLASWTEIFRFTQPTFARSFAVYNGDFYFGLGTDVGPYFDLSTGVGPDGTCSFSSYTDDLRPEAGTILKVPRATYTGNP